jgi:alanine racemase
MRQVSVIEIDLNAVRHNLAVLRRLVGPECGLCPILKADAYGLGGVQIARCLDAAGASLLAVYTLDEAKALLEAGIRAPVMVLMPVRNVDRAPGLYRALIDGRIHLTIHDQDHLQDVIALTETLGVVSLPVHLEVDTGMSRGGCDVAEAAQVLHNISASPRLDLVGVFTQFANSTTDVALTNHQLLLLDELTQEYPRLLGPGVLVHAANTVATIRNKRYHKSMVRFGLAWAGYGPECVGRARTIAESKELRPSVTWRSQLVQAKTIPAGSAVGYGSTWTARRPTRVGLVPVGYADGYPSALGTVSDSPQGRVRVMGGGPLKAGMAPVIGAVNMDQITIDLTDLWRPSNGGREVGTDIEIISADRRAANHAPTIAKAAGINTHELLSRLNPRIRRVYRSEQAVSVHVRETTPLVVG